MHILRSSRFINKMLAEPFYFWWYFRWLRWFTGYQQYQDTSEIRYRDWPHESRARSYHSAPSAACRTCWVMIDYSASRDDGYGLQRPVSVTPDFFQHIDILVIGIYCRGCRPPVFTTFRFYLVSSLCHEYFWPANRILRYFLSLSMPIIYCSRNILHASSVERRDSYRKEVYFSHYDMLPLFQQRFHR